MANVRMTWICVLVQLGFDVKVTPSGDLSFHDGEVPFLLMPEPEDPCYLRLVLPMSAIECHSTVDQTRAVELANSINTVTKVSKLMVSEHGGVFVSVESLFPDYPAAKKVIPRLIEVAKLAAYRFDEAWYAPEKEASAQLVLLR